MPKSMPKRRDGPQNFGSDSPLTVQGHFQARLLGEQLRKFPAELWSHHYIATFQILCTCGSSLRDFAGYWWNFDNIFDAYTPKFIPNLAVNLFKFNRNFFHSDASLAYSPFVCIEIGHK